MRLLVAVACAFALSMAGCTAEKSDRPPDRESSATAASSPAAAPAVKSDENGFLNEVYGHSGVGGDLYIDLSPSVLLQKGYEVCDQMERGWACVYIKRNLSDPSIYGPGEEPIAAGAAIHLSGMTQDQLDEYINTHVGVSP
jgi:hypothetical protein